MILKERIYKLVETGEHGQKINRLFDYVIMTLIILSVVSIILESINEIDEKYYRLLVGFNLFSVIVFTIEYLLRLYVSDISFPSKSRIKSALKYIFSTYGIIDLLAILPFYLPMLIKVDLRFLRVLRLTRFLRILKINRYNNALNLIWAVVKDKKQELAVTGFVTFLILLIASFLMYFAESDKQPEQFPNILATFWWAIATLTTVGYGDVYPVTGIGKIISGIIALLGIGLVALPTGLISAGFISKIEDMKKEKKEKYKKCPHCGKEIIE